jgi:hypothetical protein
VCQNASVTLTATGLTDLATSYGIIFKQYTSVTADPYIGGTVIATIVNGNIGGSGTTATTTTTFSLENTYYIYAILTPTPTDVACRPSATTTLVVNPTPNAVATPASQTICSASSIGTMALSGSVSGTTYTWTRNNTGTVTGIAASASGDISGTLTNTTSAPVTVTFTIIPTANSCVGSSITATVLVNKTSAGMIASAQSGVSPFDPAPFMSSSAPSGATGTIEYKWQFSTTSNSTGFSDIPSSNAATYDAGSLLVTTWYKRLVRLDCNADWTGAAESNVLEVTVNPETPRISGKIGWRTNPTVGILNTSVALTGDSTGTLTTLVDGLFSFEISGSNYTVTPTKTTGKMNGVTALDVTRISQHLGGTLPFLDPYEFIAADINKSNTLTTRDASILQNALLNNPIALSLFKSSWRFVPTDMMFSTPYGSTAFWNFAEKRTYAGITTAQTDQDFVAIKVGDLVTPNFNPGLKPAPAVPVVFAVPDMALTAGVTVEVPFRCEHFEDLVALQVCFWFNPEVLALDAVLPTADMPMQLDNFGTWELSEGRLRLVWAVANGETKIGSPELFKLRFRVLQGGYSLSNVLSIRQKDMEASAWHTDYRPERVSLAYYPVTETQPRGETTNLGVSFELYQNEPNPFEDKTSIGFRLSEAASATLTVYDEIGRVLFTQKGDYGKGYNAIVLDCSSFNMSGVMYYTLETATASATRKMVQMK